MTKPGIIRSQKSQDTRLDQIKQLIGALRKGDSADIALVPVSIFWGRDPGKEEKSVFKLLFSDDENAGALQKLFIVMAHGRRNHIIVDKAVSLKQFCEEALPEEELARKLYRILRVHFIKQRNTYLGQKLYNRDQIIRRIVKSDVVSDLINEEHRRHKKSIESLEEKARDYAREIAADMSYPVVRGFEILLARLWARLFHKINVTNLAEIKKLTKDYEVVFVPNHRSHIDYLLVAYVLYSNGLPNPHTAAGINLNFWLIGPLLRRGGGFFIRRRLGGNRLYTTVFSEYLHTLITSGFPIVFFLEGGRSRTGTILTPKTGLLSMVVQSFVRKPVKPIVFVPAYIGYDKVIEVISYLKELAGGSKKKESVGQLVKAGKILTGKYGSAYINFGDPIFLEDYLSKKWPEWEAANNQSKQAFPNELVVDLADQFIAKIKEATVVSPVSLVGMILLAMPRRTIRADDFVAFAAKLIELARQCYAGTRVIFPGDDLKQQLERLREIDVFDEIAEPGGARVYTLNDNQAKVMPYYKNNAIHLFFAPAVIARIVSPAGVLPRSAILQLFRDLLPFLKEEFTFEYTDVEIEASFDKSLAAMAQVGLVRHGAQGDVYQGCVPEDPEHKYLVAMAQFVGAAVDLPVITLEIMRCQSGRAFAVSELEALVHKSVTVYKAANDVVSFSSIRANIAVLKKLQLVKTGHDGKFNFTDKAQVIAERWSGLLSQEAKDAIKQAIRDGNQADGKMEA
jgi:glycerol-3-phosphate O-acyltransferase